MPFSYVSGDPLLTRAQTLAFAYNAKGRVELDSLASTLAQRHPAAFATYGKQCRGQRIKPGQIWLWHEASPRLLFMVVRDTPMGIMRLRHVDSTLLLLARDYRLYGINSVALVLPGTDSEKNQVKPLVRQWLEQSALPVVVYETYQSGAQADESALDL